MYSPNGLAQTAQALALPAPTGGLNDFDPLSLMDPSFLIEGENFFPDTGKLSVREGFHNFGPPFTFGGIFSTPIRTLIPTNLRDQVGLDFLEKLWVFNDQGVFKRNTTPPYDWNNFWTVTNGRMQYVRMTNTGTTYLIACNGVDPAILVNETTDVWANFTQVVTPTAPGEISGLNPNQICWVHTHNKRLWFVQKDSLNAYYLPVDGVGGAALPFPVAGQFGLGGKLMAIMTWSSDTGKGLDDRLIFLTDQGEIAVYTGSDPSDANNFQLDSMFRIAPPLGTRAVVQYGGDILVLTRRGVIPLSSVLYGTAQEQSTIGVLSRRVNRVIQSLTYDWTTHPTPPELQVCPDQLWVTLCIYDTANAGWVQLVMNLLTGAWGKWTMPVRSIVPAGRDVFMIGDNPTVAPSHASRWVWYITQGQHRDFVVTDTIYDSPGIPITAYAQGAFTYLDNPTQQKHAKLIRFVFESETNVSFRVRVVPDFRVNRFLGTPPPNYSQEGGVWDDVLWDAATWPYPNTIRMQWAGANALGYSMAWQMRLSTSSPVAILGVEWVWEAGGLV